MHMADALVTPAVAGTAEPEADGDAYETAAAVFQKFWRSGKHSGPYTCEAGMLPAGPFMATYYATKAYAASFTRAVERNV